MTLKLALMSENYSDLGKQLKLKPLSKDVFGLIANAPFLSKRLVSVRNVLNNLSHLISHKYLQQYQHLYLLLHLLHKSKLCPQIRHNLNCILRYLSLITLLGCLLAVPYSGRTVLHIRGCDIVPFRRENPRLSVIKEYALIIKIFLMTWNLNLNSKNRVFVSSDRKR
jgi:hypothetical protein